jgi:soluble lytic murein transglycosylase-like protein
VYEFAVEGKTLVSGSLTLAVVAVAIFAAGALTGVRVAAPAAAAAPAAFGVGLAARSERSSTPPAIPLVAAPAPAPEPVSTSPPVPPRPAAVSGSPPAASPPAPDAPPATPAISAGRGPAPPRVAGRRPPVDPLLAAAPILPLAAPAAEEPSLRFRDGQPVPPTPYGGLIYRVARRHAVNPQLVAAIVWAESGFDPTAVSSRGARGLMQILPDTAERFGVPHDRLFEPELNLAAGASYLSWLIDRYGERLELVLGAYNAGEGVIEQFGALPPYPETLGYVERVYARLGLDRGAVLR